MKETWPRENVTMYPLRRCKKNVANIRRAVLKTLQRIAGNVLISFPRTWQAATSNPLPLCASLFFHPSDLLLEKRLVCTFSSGPKSLGGRALNCHRRRSSDIQEAARGWGWGWGRVGQGRTFDPRGLSPPALPVKCDRRRRRELGGRAASMGEEGEPERYECNELSLPLGSESTTVERHCHVWGKKPERHWMVP